MLWNSMRKLPTNSSLQHNRKLWTWINIIFNKLDEPRRKQFGPDRTCAEWLLRNGASVKFLERDGVMEDYNSLPLEGTVLHVEEVDASNSSIMHHGFDHFIGCKHIKSMILHNCSYLENEALGMMAPINGSLRYLKVSSCNNITDAGVLKLANLTNLTTLVIESMSFVKDPEGVKRELGQALSKTSIEYHI